MDAREEISRWLALLVKISSESGSDQIDGDIKTLTCVSLQLSSELARRNAKLASQWRPSNGAIAHSAPPEAPQHKAPSNRSDASAENERPQAPPERHSGIMQGVQKAQTDSDDGHEHSSSDTHDTENANIEFDMPKKVKVR